MPTPAFAWCFSHGQLHRFPPGEVPWCTAQWVAFAASTEQQALEAKAAAYGEASFFEELPVELQVDVIEARATWDGAFTAESD